MHDTRIMEEKLKANSDFITGNIRDYLHRNLPKTLFHYTNSAGMMGIIKSGRLWATNYRYLNDYSEIDYGMKLFEKIVSDVRAENKNEVVDEFLQRSLRSANAFNGMFDLYITCFCARDDLLNQWRVYAGLDSGFALGFDVGQIGARRKQSNIFQNFLLRKVIYDTKLQRELMLEALTGVISILEDQTKGASIEESSNLIALACKFLRNDISEFLMCFKNPAFEVEEEWRLIFAIEGRDDKELSFRDGVYGITPYVSLDISPDVGFNRDRLPLTKITHGPSRNGENILYAVNKMLRAHDFHISVEVLGSDLPVR